MSCAHGNHVSGCDICSEIDAAYERGRLAALAAPMPEPVFWMVKGNCVGGAKDQGHVWSRPPTAEEMALWADAGIDIEIVPLYAAPPAAPASVVPDKATVDYVTTIEVLRARIAMLESAAPVVPMIGASTHQQVFDALEDAHWLSGPPHERIKQLIAERESAAPVVPLTDEQKQGLLHQVGIVTGANLTGMYGQRYRSLGTPYNVWEKDLFALIDAARAHGIGGGGK